MARAKARPKARAVREGAVPYSPKRLLLDTHVWLWWYGGERQLGREAIALIKRAPEVRFSAVSAWEISIKRAIGKISVRDDFDLSLELQRDGFTELSVSVAHAATVHHLPPLHRDPFDRLLVAQALVEGLTIITGDDAIAKYGAPCIDARR